MKRIKLLTMAMTIVATVLSGNVSAQIPDGYYDALKGKKGAGLKTAVHNIIKDANVLSYGSGKGSTWWGFYTTDNDNGYVIDRYSPEKVKFTNQGSVPGGMNIEHSFPKSWWGGSKRQAYMDLYNLMPSNSKANSSKSNYGMGVVKDASYDNGTIKVGSGSNGFKLWQPNLEWEGDFSRGYMYMATAYQDYTWTSEGLNSLEQGDYPTLKKWASDLYIKWAKEDPVSELEVKRNNAVYEIQGNRNPFIDFPNLMEYIWGDSIDYAFDPAKTVTSEHYNSGTTDPTDPTDPSQPGEDDKETTIYTANYKSTEGNCTVETTVYPLEGVDVWERTSAYGWKGTGAIKEGSNKYPTKFAANSSLLTPELDLTAYKSAKVSFSHAVNYATAPSKVLSVEVLCDDNTTALEGITWPAGNNWTFIDSGDIDLTAFAGKKIRIAFHYTSTTSEACTWEIRDIAVSGVKGTATTIGNTTDSNADFDPTKPYNAYNLGGQPTTLDKGHGVVVVKQGKNTFKLMR